MLTFALLGGCGGAGQQPRAVPEAATVQPNLARPASTTPKLVATAPKLVVMEESWERVRLGTYYMFRLVNNDETARTDAHDVKVRVTAERRGQKLAAGEFTIDELRYGSQWEQEGLIRHRSPQGSTVGTMASITAERTDAGHRGVTAHHVRAAF
jgi:hypothetical protein